jgi:hypothetical protein
MMDHMTDAMMWSMGLLSVLVIAVVILAIAALVKYLFFEGSKYNFSTPYV